MPLFLEVTAFATMFGRPLRASETAVAAPLLEVVDGWIRERKPDLPFDDPAAILVAFEVTRDALMYGKYGPLSSFQDTVAHRTKAGTIDAKFVERFITDRHREMLGINTVSTAAPRGTFKVCDY